MSRTKTLPQLRDCSGELERGKEPTLKYVALASPSLGLNVRKGWKTDIGRTSPLRSNGEGNRSAVRLSGGGANCSRAQAHQPVGDFLRIGQDIACPNAHDP